MILLPARVDFIGGWSDQLCWPRQAAVVNAAIGWEGGFNGFFPLRINDDGEVESIIQGVGTGLGVSSIIQAGLFLHQHPDSDFTRNFGYVEHALEWERQQGTQGGWQDQIGAVTAGLKLIESHGHRNFRIRRVRHAIVNHLVLFDTGLRREAKAIGDQVRHLIANSVSFQCALSCNVDEANRAIIRTAKEFALTCIEGWQRLNRHVEMDVPVPQTELAWGHKLVGAGGGGYGVMFVKHPDSRDEVIRILEDFGYRATIPVILDGAQRLTADEQTPPMPRFI